MDPLSRFSRARLRVRFGVVAVATAFVASAIGAGVFAIGGFGGTPSSPSPTAKLTLVAARTPTPGPTPTASPNPTPSPSPSPTPNDLAHRPFTVLVLGGDDVLLTDAVIVVGIDPLKRTIAYASIPRDTIDILLPGGGVWRDRKINEFYNYAAAHPQQFPQGPGRATADAVGLTLGITIDFYALTWFQGFVNLVEAMGGIPITLSSPVVDPYYEVTTTNVGIRFPAGSQTLTPARALIFVRTRLGDNDFHRSKRQQEFLTAGGLRLLAKPALLPELLAAVVKNVKTDLPLDQGLLVLDAMTGFDPTSVRGVVFSPRKYSAVTPCSCGYALEPKLAAIRVKAAALFPWAVATSGVTP